MTYVIPAMLCWAVAVSVVGRGWFTWDRSHFSFSWLTLVMLATAAIVVLIVWPPGVIQMMVIQDFWTYLHYPFHPTLVGDKIYEITPLWSFAYWMAHIDAPMLVFSVLILVAGAWKARRQASKSRGFSPQHIYLGIFLILFLATALKAHIAGARNMLQFLGVLCLATGATFDDALAARPRLLRPAAAIVIVVLAGLNYVWLSRSSTYIPFFATDGYQAFVKENGNRLLEPVAGSAYGVPILKLYAEQYNKPIAWDLHEAPWAAVSSGVDLRPGTRYVLMPVFFNYMPVGQPLRSVVAEHWKVAWSYKVDHVWELRLYENPETAAPK
jgi:hypothetical protein